MDQKQGGYFLPQAVAASLNEQKKNNLTYHSMKKLCKLKDYTLDRGTGYNYKDALNYDGTHYYNSPVTVTYKNKKYILGCGTQDNIRLFKMGGALICISHKPKLNYIGFSIYELETGERTTDYFIEDQDLSDGESPFFKLDFKRTEEQVKYLINL